MTIWGVDLGVRSLYVARIDGSVLTLFSKSYRIHKQSRGDELAGLHAWLGDTLEHGPVAIEEPPLAGSRNLRTFLALAQVSGITAAAAGPEAILVPVSSWKKGTVGNGAASKDLVSAWLRRVHPDYHKACAGDQNLIDATCIALYAHMGQG